MKSKNRGRSKPPFLQLIMILFILVQSVACSTETTADSPITATFTPAPPTLAPTQAPPTSTPTPSFTDTPTSIPTSTFIPGSEAPFKVAGLELQLVAAGLEKNYKGFVPSNITSSQIVLWVDVELLAGEMDTLIALEKWVEDENGSKIEIGTGLSTGSRVTWLFAVPITSTFFVLHFSSGEAVDLMPMLP